MAVARSGRLLTSRTSILQSQMRQGGRRDAMSRMYRSQQGVYSDLFAQKTWTSQSVSLVCLPRTHAHGLPLTRCVVCSSINRTDMQDLRTITTTGVITHIRCLLETTPTLDRRTRSALHTVQGAATTTTTSRICHTTRTTQTP